MASLLKGPCTLSTTTLLQPHPSSQRLSRCPTMPSILSFKSTIRIRSTVFCTKLTPWEPAPVAYASAGKTGDDDFLKKTSDIFETLNSEGTAEAQELTKPEEYVDVKSRPRVQLQILKWPLWLLGPSLLLATGMVPTLWLPLSSVYLGPNIASLLSLIGLDCIFNLGATLFLLMADSCSRPKKMEGASNSKPPFNYKLWNMAATVSGLVIPLVTLFGSQRGLLQPQLPFIPSAVLLGPYVLLLSVQMLTEMLTWHWQSTVWLVTPVIYESYRVLQLMRGLKLGAELSAPGWTMHLIRGMVCWWILVLGIQLMSVAWFAGFAARAGQKRSTIEPDG